MASVFINSTDLKNYIQEKKDLLKKCVRQILWFHEIKMSQVIMEQVIDSLTATRIFQTVSPISNQHGDNVTFTVIFRDYAGNLATVNATTDTTYVKYDDQIPVLTRIEISSDNVNSLTEND